MRNFFAVITLLCFPFIINAQFEPVEQEKFTIIVTDGTDEGKKSEVQPKGNADTKKGKGVKRPKNYEHTSSKVFVDPIRPLGMNNAIQAAAFLERPKYGRAGFLLIFCVNDSIGDKQGTYDANGQSYKGVYRLIRQKFTPEEPIPEGMAPYKLIGTFFILGVS